MVDRGMMYGLPPYTYLLVKPAPPLILHSCRQQQVAQIRDWGAKAGDKSD